MGPLSQPQAPSRSWDSVDFARDDGALKQLLPLFLTSRALHSNSG
jgi:hypothetical protein